MKLENQCVSLELAKKLKELGVKQESLFRWVLKDKTGYFASVEDSEKSGHKESLRWIITDNCSFSYTPSAFTVAELGILLPDRVWFEDGSGLLSWLVTSKLGDDYWTISYHRDIERVSYELTEKGEADARAKMLVYLLENKLI